jgi:hypothetical protein
MDIAPTRPFEICIGEKRRSAASKAGNVDDIESCSPAQERIGEKVHLPERQVIRRAPVGVHIRKQDRIE